MLGLDKFIVIRPRCDDVGCDECAMREVLQSMPIYNSPALEEIAILNTPIDRAPVSCIARRLHPLRFPYLDSVPITGTGPRSPYRCHRIQIHGPQDHQWLRRTAGPPSSGLPLGTPPALEPEVMEHCRQIEPAVDPPIQRPPLTNPFKDDAKVTKQADGATGYPRAVTE